MSAPTRNALSREIIARTALNLTDEEGLAALSMRKLAAEAGLSGGDVVVELNRSPIGSFGDLAAVVGRLEPGDRVPVVVTRRGERIELDVVIGQAGGR